MSACVITINNINSTKLILELLLMCVTLPAFVHIYIINLLYKYRGGSGNLKMVRPLTDNGFNGGGLVRCDIKLYTALTIITTE